MLVCNVLIARGERKEKSALRASADGPRHLGDKIRFPVTPLSTACNIVDGQERYVMVIFGTGLQVLVVLLPEFEF